MPGRGQPVGGFIPARCHQCRLCSCWALPCSKPRISWADKNRGRKYHEGRFHCLCYQLGQGGGRISTRRNPLWSLHWSLSQLNREYWAVYKLQITAILAHEHTGAWVVFSVCWAAKPGGRAALSTTLSLTCRVQEKQHALQPRKRQLNLSSNYKDLEQNPCKGKLVCHGSADYSKCMKFAWNFVNLPL